ncbi:MAG: ATP-binding cassette domain-containing protein [Polyangiaceae bacterium]|nr:ATP-binding cassette domain-containing protein [Polyangiaceae bacterium]
MEARGVTCRFGDKVAVHKASVRLFPGQIHALVGENGAGKSTLLKAMAGAVVPTEGEVWIRGQRLDPATPAEAIRRGVGMVYQHFALVPSFTGMENLMLGVEPVGLLGWLRPSVTRARAEEIAAMTRLRVHLDVPAASLSVGEQQRLEILRVLVRGASLLLLDEPTAVLTPGEAQGLYELLRRIAKQGAAVAVVTHHLEDVSRYADQVTVLRGGEQVFQGAVSEVTTAELSLRALGEIPAVKRPTAVGGEAPELLVVVGLQAEGLDVKELRVRRGEMVGIAGVDGNGQEALVEALAGLRPARGSQRLGGCELAGAPPSARRAAGLEVVHGDRHRFALLAGATIHDNLVLGDLGPDEEAKVVRRMAVSGLIPADPSLQAGTLSGGNQQKLVMARALDRAPRMLVAAYPTRGIDAAAAAQIQQRLVAAAEGGAGVLLISGDWSELRTIAHRLLVMRKGRVVAELPPDVREQELGRVMLEGS